MRTPKINFHILFIYSKLGPSNVAVIWSQILPSPS